MGLVVTLPAIPPPDTRPLCALIGVDDWQVSFARAVLRSAGGILTTRAGRPGEPSHLWWDGMLAYAEIADVIVLWQGRTPLYLDLWTLSGLIVGRYADKVIAGSDPAADHPMAPGLNYLLAQSLPRVWGTLDETMSAAIEALRAWRREHS